MQYLNREDLKQLFAVAAKYDSRHHLCLLVSVMHGLRVSEVIKLRGTDFHQGKLIVQRLKGSKKTIQPVRLNADEPLFDESAVIELAKQCGDERLFKYSRKAVDRFIKKYAKEAGLRDDCQHHHMLKHTAAMLIWSKSQSIGEVQNWLGHKSSSSSMAYLYEIDEMKAFASLSAAL